MQRKIVSFERDELSDWKVILECGHTQHVRHNPPWLLREWVITPEGRESRLGTCLECARCDQPSIGDE